jgi:hypothetical protein
MSAMNNQKIAVLRGSSLHYRELGRGGKLSRFFAFYCVFFFSYFKNGVVSAS